MEKLHQYIQHLTFVDEDDPEWWSEQIKNSHPELSLRMVLDLVYVFSDDSEKREEIMLELSPGEVRGLIGHIDGPSGMAVSPDRYEIRKVTSFKG